MNNSKEIIQIQELKQLEIIDNEIRIKAQNFQKILHKEPSKKEIKINKLANNSKYLPISFLEMLLDELFFGLWQTTNFTYMVIANEIVGSIELKYFHPTHKIWLSRIGTGAVQIQMRSKEKGGSGDITNIKDKYINTLTKDFPHLKAECFRNACISLGKSFGRDLNREFEDQYNPIITPNDDNNNEINDIKIKLIAALDKYTGEDKKELKDMCLEKQKAGEFDIKFAQGVAKQLGLEL